MEANAWPRPLLVYSAVALPIFLVATRPVPVQIKLFFAYAVLGLFLWSVRAWLGGPRAGELRPYRSEPAATLWLTTVGYFLLVMAVRLPIYAKTGQIWDKTPMIALVLSSLFLWERLRASDFGLHARDWRRQAAVGALLFVVAWIGVALGFYVRELIVSGPPAVALGGSLDGALYNLLMFGYGNFGEELFFRGYVQTKFRRQYGVTAALCMQAALFALYHVNYRIFPRIDWPGLLLYLWFTFAFGIVVGVIAERTRGLIAPTIVHVGYNVCWPGGLFYLGFRSAETLRNAALPWFVFLLFTVPMSLFVLDRFGYRRRTGGMGEGSHASEAGDAGAGRAAGTGGEAGAS